MSIYSGIRELRLQSNNTFFTYLKSPDNLTANRQYTMLLTNSKADGRLTLTSGTPVPTTNALAATTLYYTPYVGNEIGLYNGTSWDPINFAETSLSLSGYTADTNFDIWAYNNAGTLALESTAWTNGTTRATALVRQDGVWSKTGALTRRYLGTIRTTAATGQCEFNFGDSTSNGVGAKFYVYNAHNRIRFVGGVTENSAPWNNVGNVWRAYNGSNNNRVSLIQGLTEDPVCTSFRSVITAPSSQGALTAIGVDSTTAPALSGNAFAGVVYPLITAYCEANADPGALLGFHYYQMLEAVFNNESSGNFQGGRMTLDAYL